MKHLCKYFESIDLPLSEDVIANNRTIHKVYSSSVYMNLMADLCPKDELFCSILVICFIKPFSG